MHRELTHKRTLIALTFLVTLIGLRSVPSSLGSHKSVMGIVLQGAGRGHMCQWDAVYYGQAAIWVAHEEGETSHCRLSWTLSTLGKAYPS